MIDFVKLELPNGTGQAWFKHPFLALPDLWDRETGEGAPMSEATYRHLTFRVYRNGRAFISGSLHKYWHGQHNGGDFPAWAVQAAITELADSFGFRPEDAQLRGFEFGLNVPLPGSATSLLKRAVLYKTLAFDSRSHGGHGYSLQAEAQQYSFKLYDKERHLAAYGHPAPGPLVRAEVKVRKMCKVHGTGIVTLADLAAPDRLTALGPMLQQAYADTLFAAVQVPTTLSEANQRLLLAGAAPSHWQDLQKRPASFQKDRQRYRDLTTHEVPDVLALAAAAGLVAGWNRLLVVPAPIRELTDLPPLTIRELTDLPNAAGSAVYPSFNTLCIGVETSKAVGSTGAVVKTCQTCGRDITDQAPDSKFCSEATYGAAGKRCRNAASNPGHNARRDVSRRLRVPALFDQRPYFQLSAPVRAYVADLLA